MSKTMRARKIELDFSYSKSYKTVENLDKAVEKMAAKIHLDCAVRYVVHTLPNGRFTPMFMDTARHGVSGFIAQSNFMVVS